MDYLIRRLITDFGADESLERKQDLLLRVAKLLEEVPTAAPTTDRAERIRRQRQAYKSRRDAVALERNPIPLAILAAKERELAENSTFAEGITQFDRRRPDPNLVTYQVTRCLNPAVSGHQRIKILKEGLSLFDALGSRDAIDSMIDRLMFAAHSTGMACCERAAKTNNNLRALDVNIRGLNKCAKTLLELEKRKEERLLRRQPRLKADQASLATDSAADSSPVSIPLNGRASQHDAPNGNGANNGKC